MAYTGTPNTLQAINNITSQQGDVEAATGGKGFICGNGAKLIDGSGSPNGSVSAPQGSLYLRTDGGIGTRVYVNSNGGTSWIALTSL